MLAEEVKVKLVGVQPRQQKTLDAYEWEGMNIRLFYEGKLLRLELTRVIDPIRLKLWTFCLDKRHLEKLEVGPVTIHVEYRPAQITIRFSRNDEKKGFIGKVMEAFRSPRLHWVEYALRPDGLVSITRPGESKIVG